jgi:two-component sensor histidine kinase/PAS domain-containing protein
MAEPGVPDPRTGRSIPGRILGLVLPRIESPLGRLAVAMALIGAATLGRLGLGQIDPQSAPFVLYVPAVLLAAFLGGWRVGAVAAAASVVLAYVLFIAREVGIFHPTSIMLLNVGLYAAAAAAVVAIAGQVGALIEGLAQSRAALRERNRQYDGLFAMMSEGFALCEAIRDEAGLLIDYVVVEMNPALQRMLGVGPEAIGGRLSAAPGDHTAWLRLCDRVLRTGAPSALEYHNLTTGLWHEIHINPVTPTQVAQLFFDITERKATEEHKARLFDELHHRVKNNLGVVSAILSMQARRAEPATRADLMKAVDRVLSIADVHESLSHGRAVGMVDFGAYLRNLCDRLSTSMLDDDRIRIVVEAQSMDIAAEHAVPLGIVVNELVTNAVKYAYPAPDRGLITVAFGASKDGPRLTVGDTGRGLPDEIEAAPGGMGLSIIRSMVRQVGASLSVRRSPGTAFEILLAGDGAAEVR